MYFWWQDNFLKFYRYLPPVLLLKVFYVHIKLEQHFLCTLYSPISCWF